MIRGAETTLKLESVLDEEDCDSFSEDTTQFFAVWTTQFGQNVKIDQANREIWETAEGKLIEVESELGDNEQPGIWHL